jgi:hypothetical protein
MKLVCAWALNVRVIVPSPAVAGSQVGGAAETFRGGEKTKTRMRVTASIAHRSGVLLLPIPLIQLLPTSRLFASIFFCFYRRVLCDHQRQEESECEDEKKSRNIFVDDF